jgi:hypothetical protein
VENKTTTCSTTPSVTYSPSLTLEQARNQYFLANDFSEQAYQEAWAKIKLGPIYFYIPNIAGRKEALRIHDLHHVLNEYDTSYAGESEIAAWEIASGVPLKYIYGTFLDATTLLIGLVRNPRRVAKAWKRGRHSKNLYRQFAANSSIYPELLKTPVGKMRKDLGIN